ncbi:MAG: class I SAM-dependent methyltransferase [Candidatus Omnitrophica bacterium]|nr:class I SAM-dependent methyltransferase [Candidatus Omnitrophota bacterium]
MISVIEEKIEVGDAVDKLLGYLISVKAEFDKYDKEFTSEAHKIKILIDRKKEIFNKLDEYYESIWVIFKNLSEIKIQLNKKYCEDRLLPYLTDDIEINAYIRNKPLGYAGDYVTMNYIFDFHKDRFLGSTLYAKLLNNYSCNIDVSCSNIFRKDYLKNKISGLFRRSNVKILSIGCGPARELIELAQQNNFLHNIEYHLLDLEKNAINFVRTELNKIDYDKNKLKINYHLIDLITLVKDSKLKQKFYDFDLIYISGVFDYLSDRLCQKVVYSLLDSIKTSGEMIVFNMSIEKSKNRAFYEVLGDWFMNHRSKESILSWKDKIKNSTEFFIDEYPECVSYWILNIIKK